MRRPGLLLGLLAIVSLPENAGAQTTGQKEAQTRSGSFRVRYNRVEGLFLGYRLKGGPKTRASVRLFAEAGYGLHNASPRWEVGVAYVGDRVSATAAVFDRTEFEDVEPLPTNENSLFSLIFKRDDRNYFRARNGFEARSTYRLRPTLHLFGMLSAYAYESMPVETGWSLFFPDRRFRANPEVRPGDLGRLALGFVADTGVKGPAFRSAWYVRAVYERGFRAFDYRGAILTMKRYQKVRFGNQAIVLRARVGTRESAAEQHRFYLGGVTTLRGYGIKAFFGNRMILINADYLFRGDLFSRLPGLRLLNLILFVDTGWISPELPHKHLFDGFQDVNLHDFKTNAGLAVAFSRRLFRINVARRFDGTSDPWTVSVRLMRAL